MARSLPRPLRRAAHVGRVHGHVLSQHGLDAYARWAVAKAQVAWRRRSVDSAYRLLSEAEARARRRSDTVFVFGSGASLNDLTPAEWAHFTGHDVLGFSGFVYQRWVRTDFHLVRGWDYGQAESQRRWFRSATTYAGHITANPYFAGTVFVLQDEYRAVFARALMAYRLLPRGASILTFRTRTDQPTIPSVRLADGLSHAGGTLFDTVNLAFALGWRRIVLVGVDLYDSRYFWVRPDQTVAFDASGDVVGAPMNLRGTRAGERHPVLRNRVVELMEQWAAMFAAHDVSLSVYNPRSLLTSVLPVYEHPSGARAGAVAP